MVCENGFAGCGITCNGGGGTELPEDVLAEQEKGACTKAICSTVDKNAYFCDKTKGTFYFDASKGTCDAENTCMVCENGFAGCGITCSDTCDGEDYTGTCAEDKKTAVVCVKGETKNHTCFKDICETRTDGTIYCPKDQKAIDNETARRACIEGGKEILKEGGAVGDCCDTENYKPAGCVEATNSGLRCSTGVIVEWTCQTGKTCSFDPDSTEYPGGKYSCI